MALTNREKAAELYVLEGYDRERIGLGHDYGGGQRVGELMRRRRELREADGDLVTTTLYELEHDEIAAAFDRVGVPRLRRIRREIAKWGTTESTNRTLLAWERLERRRLAGRPIV